MKRPAATSASSKTSPATPATSAPDTPATPTSSDTPATPPSSVSPDTPDTSAQAAGQGHDRLPPPDDLACAQAEVWRQSRLKTAQGQGINETFKKEDKVKCYRDMVRIRCFEQRSLRAYQQGDIGGFLHLYEGQEAVAVGTVSLLSPQDHLITAYRDHGHALAVGMSMDVCMAEMFGKVDGCSKGKGGSMHFFDPSKNFWGGHGIVGGQVPLGTGLAFALKYRNIKGAALAFMGDGAVNQGAVHEAMNLAALWSLPILFIIENNRYSMGTSQTRSSAYPSCLAERALAYDMDWDTADGNNLYDVRFRTHAALQRAYQHSRPTLLECFTYRHRGHSIADANHQKYRSKQEITGCKLRWDPIAFFATELQKEGLLNATDIKTIEKAAREEAEQSITFAQNSPFPAPQSIFEDIYYEADHPDTKRSLGRTIFEHAQLLP